MARFAEEKPLLRALPSERLPEYTEVLCRVRKWSTIRVFGKTYSVDSRLIGQCVTARLSEDRVEVYLSGQRAETILRIEHGDSRIDYRHVIDSLVRKPGAFARYREEMFPTLVFCYIGPG